MRRFRVTFSENMSSRTASAAIFFFLNHYKNKLESGENVIHKRNLIFHCDITFALVNVLKLLNDTHRKKLCFTQFSTGMAASDVFHVFTQSIKFYTFRHQCRCLKNVIHQIDRKNEWLLLSTSFTTKFGLVFVLTLKDAFSLRFHFQANRKSIDSSKKRY